MQDIFNDNGDVTVSVRATWHHNEEVAGSLIQEVERTSSLLSLLLISWQLMEKNPDVRLPMGIIKAHPFFHPGL